MVGKIVKGEITRRSEQFGLIRGRFNRENEAGVSTKKCKPIDCYRVFFLWSDWAHTKIII